MNLSYFISGRISGANAGSFSRFITRLAVLATALSVAVMIIAVGVVQGFKSGIQDKLFGFWGHFHIALTNPNPSSILAPEPIPYDSALVRQVRQYPHINSIQPFAVKPAIIKSGDIIEGIKLKGVDKDYRLKDNKDFQFKGRPLQFSEAGYARQVILSENKLATLKRRIGDSILLYFINNSDVAPGIRKVAIAGSFKTGVEEVDKNFALCDINLIRRVNGWDTNSINGYQVVTDDVKHATQIAEDVYRDIVEQPLTTNTIADIYPDIYGWLSLIDVNTEVIIIIMSVVAFINMATALLIFITERTPMIGVLKSLGMSNARNWRIFLFYGARVCLKGILIGTVLGVALCLIQQYTHVIKMDESIYYVSYAPVQLVWWQVLLVVGISIAFCISLLTIPALLVRKINMVKALRFK